MSYEYIFCGMQSNENDTTDKKIKELQTPPVIKTLYLKAMIIVKQEAGVRYSVIVPDNYMNKFSLFLRNVFLVQKVRFSAPEHYQNTLSVIFNETTLGNGTNAEKDYAAACIIKEAWQVFVDTLNI